MEAITRELNRLSRIGIIERERGTLVVNDVNPPNSNGS
jgi:hypothetical protein